MKGKTKKTHKIKIFKRRALIKKNYTSSYTGSPDSEVIANYLDKFVFDPSKKEAVLNHFRVNVMQKGSI